MTKVQDTTPPRPPPDAEAEPAAPVTDEARNGAAELAVLFPGRAVKIGDTVTITVHPMLVRHMRKFAEPIERAIDNLVTSGVNFEALGESWPQLIRHLTPLLLNDLFGLLNQCTDAELDDVPHWVLPEVAGAWIEENFGTEQKLRPWFEVVSRILAKLGNEKIDLWETVSSALLRPDTTAETS